MFKNYLKITFRSLWKSKVFVLINVLGMGVSMACCIVAYLNYTFNTDFDKQHVNASEIYRVDFVRDFQGNITNNGIAPQPLANSVRDELTGVEEVVSCLPVYANIRINDDLFATDILYADEGFLNTFTFPLISGVKTDLSDKSKIFISDKVAEKYFGDEEALGKQITHILDSGTQEYVVAGVFEKMPSNSSFQFDAVTIMDNYATTVQRKPLEDWTRWNVMFLQVPDKGDIPAIENQLQKYVPIQNKAREDFKVTSFYLEPFEGMAVRAERDDMHNHWFRNSLPTPAVFAPMIMSFLILLIAISNFTNTSIAISSRRLKEIGIRKVMGSRKGQVIAQFLLENVTLCLLSAIVALIMAEVLAPAYSQMWDFVDLDLNYLTNARFLLFMFGLLILTGILAGSYPAFYISKFEATSILKGTFKFGGTNWLTKSLLCMQFSISLIALIAAVAFIQNANYQKEFDFGFEKDGIIYTFINGKQEFEAYKNQLSKNEQITAIGGTKHHIFSSIANDPVKYNSLEFETDIMEVDYDYMDIMGMTLVEGRKFNKDSETDRKESVIINETLAAELGLDEPLGAKLVWADTVPLYVVGVVKDYYSSGLWEEIDPTILRLNKEEEISRIIVKAKVSDLKEVNEFMAAEWKELFPNRMYNAVFMDSDSKEASNVNDNILKLFIFLGLVATLLSASGLFSMVSLNIIKKMKEIGVRKVLGASVSNIAYNLNFQFYIILFIAAILGSLASFYFIDSLMASIWKFYQHTNVLTFLIGIVLILIVSSLTIGSKVFNAASMNPVDTLRDE